jgi:hypothetical protein
VKIVALSALLAIGLSATAQAQTTITGQTGSSATAIVVAPGAGNGTGNGGLPNGVGYLNTNQTGTVWTLGIAPPATAATSYDACLKNIGISAIAGAISIPLEISHCWALRDMDAMAKFPPGSIQYEHGCRDSAWLNTDWVSGTLACTANKAKLAKQNPNDPRAAQVVAIPVVQAGHGKTVPNGVPPTVVPVTATNAQPSLSQVVPGPASLPRCKGPNDQSRCFSG